MWISEIKYLLSAMMPLPVSGCYAGKEKDGNSAHDRNNWGHVLPAPLKY